ncbi:hypothetical protein GXP70_18245 [Paenibacillus lycopersici]|uniref:Uncharacterized protein n=1 Tax=Paenibacillus lycopersici TaxID=2704462 RepID=A0A6C0G1F3_9BACL|nr:hypothetical protein [Paenibacillus lycopersici]QHT61723.1 hypothetical protein GXP70_18245 [Paenibacillus lycopersici]
MLKDQARDLEEDLALCEAATPSQWSSIPCRCGECNMQFISVAWSEGRFEPADARFITAAREGWPYAIRRALELEVENDRLREEISLMQEQVQQHRSLCYD